MTNPNTSAQHRRITVMRGSDVKNQTIPINKDMYKNILSEIVTSRVQYLKLNTKI